MERKLLSAEYASDSAKQLVTEAESLFSHGKVSASEDLCRRALKKDNLNVEALVEKARILRYIG